jgi:hypothetical protein
MAMPSKTIPDEKVKRGIEVMEILERKRTQLLHALKGRRG